MSDDFQKVLPTIARSVQITKEGDAAVQQGDWTQAKILYQQAYALWPQYPEVIYGLAQCAVHDGDLPTALTYYRTNVYAPDNYTYGTVKGDGYATNDATRLLEFALLLSQANQSDEAMTNYNRGVGFVNYLGGEQDDPVLFPEFGTGPAQTPYNAALLQAMAHAAIATRHLSYEDAEAVSHAQQAAALAPNNAVVQFYLGYCLQNANFTADAKPIAPAVKEQNFQLGQAAYKKAALLGSGQVQVAARKAIR